MCSFTKAKRPTVNSSICADRNDKNMRNFIAYGRLANYGEKLQQNNLPTSASDFVISDMSE